MKEQKEFVVIEGDKVVFRTDKAGKARAFQNAEPSRRLQVCKLKWKWPFLGATRDDR